MERRYALIAVAATAALASTASLIAGLRHALRREHEPHTPLDEREQELKHIRDVMGDLLAPPVNYDNWPEHLRPTPDLPDADTLRRSLPYNERPIWHDLREQRDSGY